MARLFGAGNSLQYTSGAIASTYPFTMACWFYSTSNSANQYLMQLRDSTDGDFCALQLRGDQAGDPIFAQSFDGATDEAKTSSGYSTSTWQHAAAVFSATNSRAVYLNGGSKGTNVGSTTSSGFNQMYIADNNVSGTRNIIGAIANAAMWNVVLTDAEILQLAKGVSPIYVRPASIQAYWMLVGNLSPEIDIINNYDMSLVGSPTKQGGRWIYAGQFR